MAVAVQKVLWKGQERRVALLGEGALCWLAGDLVWGPWLYP